MKKYIARICFLMAISALPFAGLVPLATVSAHPGHDHGETQQVSDEARQKAVADARRKMAEIKEKSKQRLDEAKRKVCETHQSSIQKYMQRMVDQRQKQIEHISKISQQVQDFQADQATTVANYDALVSDAAAKKAAAQAVLDGTKSAPAFACTSDGPKAQLQVFRERRAVVLKKIRSYRDAVKKLTAAIKQGQPTKGAQS